MSKSKATKSKTAATKSVRTWVTRKLKKGEAKPAKVGNPFFAFRVPSDVLRAFKAYAKDKKATPPELVRAYMSKVTGVALVEAGEE